MTSRSAMSSSSSSRSAATHRPTHGAARSGPTSTQHRPHAGRRARPRETDALPLWHGCGRLCVTWREACTGGGRSARTRPLLTPALPWRSRRLRWRATRTRASSVAVVCWRVDRRSHPRGSGGLRAGSGPRFLPRERASGQWRGTRQTAIKARAVGAADSAMLRGAGQVLMVDRRPHRVLLAVSIRAIAIG